MNAIRSRIFSGRTCSGALLAGCLLVWIGMDAVTAAEVSATNAPSPASPLPSVRLAGRVVCIPEQLQRTHGAELPTQHEHLWGFLVDDGRLLTLLRGRYSEALFLDERLRGRPLVLRGRIFPGSQVLEVSLIHSLRDGVEHDLYYYCDVCSIKSVSPEICACCREPVRLVEKPLTDKTEQP